MGKRRGIYGISPAYWIAFRDQMQAELSDILDAEIPPVFQRPGRPKALMIGIDRALIAEYPDVDEDRLYAWLRRWTSSRPYLFRLALGKYRHNLNGDDVEEISHIHRLHACNRLHLRVPARSEAA